MRKSIWKPALLLLALALGAAPAWAQNRGKIAGRVTDAVTGEALPGVNVVIEGLSVGAATDAAGDYFIANVQVGAYTLRATFLGYDAAVVEGVDVRPGGTARVDVALQPATLEMGDEVVVTAARPLVERDNTTSSVRLGQEEVIAKPTTELTGVLTTLPSVDVTNGQVTVRGGGLDEVAFLVDGARARNPLNHDPYTRINLSAVQELEVITGSFNAEYGEAQSGVINVITKEGNPDRYEVYVDGRYTPPGVRHWGASFYDRSDPAYWENSHALHAEWWVENADQWVDPNGTPGTDPASIWTPEEAYQHYLDTHQPLNDYADTPTYQVEVGFGGPVVRGLTFFATGKYRSEAPLFGNAYRSRGEFLDGNLKVAYSMGGGKKLVASGFFGTEEAGWGYYNDYFWALNYGPDSRYAYYDFAGYPYAQTNGQSVEFSHALTNATLYSVRLNRVQAVREISPFPGDSLGFDASDATRSHIRAVDANGNPIPGGYADRIGFNTTGYYFRYDDDNTEWNVEAELRSQLNKFVALQGGLDFSYYVLDHSNFAKFPDRFDDRTYRPYQGALYGQSKLEYGGLIVNAGLRLDYYNPNDTLYTSIFDPFGVEAEREDTRVYAQLSPRIGVSHPIDSRTVLHFSYGHFFQRPPFNDYGEGNDSVFGSLNTFLIEDTGLPWVLANRNLRPRKTVAFEVGIERNFWDFFVLDVTGYYKDIRNTIRTIIIESPQGTYRTNGNGNYADQRGVEVSLRKVPSAYRWGRVSGYVNFTTQIGIQGRSGDPVALLYDGEDLVVRYASSGDFISHQNPRLKAGLYYEVPTGWGGLAGDVLGGLSASLDYRVRFANEQLREDFFLFDDVKYVRPADQIADLRLRKEFALPRGTGRIAPYLEVTNVFNQRWLFLQAFERASREDQRRFVESGFEELPSVDANGIPILDVAKYRNLPRAVVFGVTLEY